MCRVRKFSRITSSLLRTVSHTSPARASAAAAAACLLPRSPLPLMSALFVVAEGDGDGAWNERRSSPPPPRNACSEESRLEWKTVPPRLPSWPAEVNELLCSAFTMRVPRCSPGPLTLGLALGSPSFPALAPPARVSTGVIEAAARLMCAVEAVATVGVGGPSQPDAACLMAWISTRRSSRHLVLSARSRFNLLGLCAVDKSQYFMSYSM